MEETADPEGTPNAPVRALYRGLSALDILRTEGEVRTTDIASRLEMDKGAASRILQTLTLTGYAERVQGRRYRPGSKLGKIGEQGGGFGSIRPAAQPLLASLSAQTGEATYLGAYIDGQVLYLDKVVPETNSALKVDRPIPTLSPLYCTAIGKLFVAFGRMPLPPTLPAYTEKTIVDPAAYRKDIDLVVKRGYSYDDEEYNLGVRCVAAGLFSASGRIVGVLSLAAPTVRLRREDMERTAVLTKSLADTFAWG